MKSLEARLRLGTAWEDRSKAVLEKPQRTLAELEDAAHAYDLFENKKDECIKCVLVPPLAA